MGGLLRAGEDDRGELEAGAEGQALVLGEVVDVGRTAIDEPEDQGVAAEEGQEPTGARGVGRGHDWGVLRIRRRSFVEQSHTEFREETTRC